MYVRYDHIKNLNEEDRCYCHKCDELLLKVQKDLHIEHSEMIEESINDFKLSHPSQV